MSFRLNALRPKNTAGLPTAKLGNLFLLYVDDILEMPETNAKGILTTGNIVLKAGRRFHVLYLTPKTQKYNIDIEGETQSSGFKKKVSGYHPGNELEIQEWVKNNVNNGFVIVYESCDSEYRKILGSKCNPLFFKGSWKDDTEGKGYDLNFEQTFADETPILFYNGNILVDEDATVEPGVLPDGIMFYADFEMFNNEW